MWKTYDNIGNDKMDIYELAQKIPNNNPHKEIILLARLWEEAYKFKEEFIMKTNEWGVKPGTQDNITPEDAPMLSDMECDLVNIFRAMPEPMQKEAFKAIFELVRQVHD